MKLSEKKVQELKENKISIKDLDDRCFITSRGFNEVKVDNILKLLNENICSFEKIVDKFKSTKTEHNAPCLKYLLNDKEFFKELVQNNRPTEDDLKYLLNKIDNAIEAWNLSQNTVLLKYIIDRNILSFRELASKFENIKDTGNNHSCLYMLLNKKELFNTLIQNNRLNKEDLKYLLNRIDTYYELDKLNENIILLKHIVDIASFKELVDKFKSIKDDRNAPCLEYLLENTELFKKLIKNNLYTDDLRHLLNEIDEWNELHELCDNTPLIKHILNEFVLNTEDVYGLYTIIENDERCKDRGIYTVFDWIEFHAIHEWDEEEEEYYERDENEIDQELLELNELNRKVYLLNILNLNVDQKIELIKVLRNNEIAQNRLKEIIKNHVESNYDFDSLITYLKKKEKKNMLNI